MKVLFDTTLYIAWLREKKYADLMLDIRTHKYLSTHVLMELWAGAVTKKAGRIVEKLQRPYMKANRIVELNSSQYISVGQILSDLPDSQKQKTKEAGFINDMFIGMSALSIGASLYTANRSDFELIASYIPQLKVVYV